MEKHAVIALHLRNVSFRCIAKELGIDRKTVAKICHRYDEIQNQLQEGEIDTHLKDEFIRELVEGKTYDSSKRKQRRFTNEMKKRIKELLESEKEKTKLLGMLTNKNLQEKMHMQCLLMKDIKLIIEPLWFTGRRKMKSIKKPISANPTS